MLALNLPYITCPGFEFNQDLTSEELPFKFKNTKAKGPTEEGSDKKLGIKMGRVIYDRDNDI